MYRSSKALWYKLAVAALVMGVVVQGSLVFRRNQENSLGPVTEPEVGDALPDISIVPASGRADVSLSTVTSGCAVLIFFNSKCPACEKAVPTWRDHDLLRRDSTSIPVIWIGNSRDRSRLDWLQRHGITRAYTATNVAYRELGVTYVPQAYVVGADRTLLGATIGRYDDVRQLSLNEESVSQCTGIQAD